MHSGSHASMYSGSKYKCIRSFQMLIVIVGIFEHQYAVTCFNTCTPFIYQSILNCNIIHSGTFSTRLFANESANDDVARQLAKAKELLQLSKAKLAAQEQEVDSNEDAKEKKPVVLETSEIDEKRLKVTKYTNDESGLITTDGELMASLSEEEDWEVRSLIEVFEDELEESEVSKQLRKRDVAASIVNLRMSMHNDDYRKIFNTRNRFIGEN